jgi:hypothetical protein
MPKKANIQTMDELREFFDVQAVMKCFLDGKLKTWLEDRNYEEAEAVRQLERDLSAQLCAIFGVKVQQAPESSEMTFGIKEEREGFHRKAQTYKVSSGFDTMLDDKKREVSKETFNRIQAAFRNWQYDPLKDSRAIIDVINGSGLQGYGKHFTDDTRIADVISSSDLRGYVKNYLNRLA